MAENEDSLAEDNQELISQGEGSGTADPKTIDVSGHIFHVDDMARAVIEDRDPTCTGEEARKSVNLILALYKSAQTGREVRL